MKNVAIKATTVPAMINGNAVGKKTYKPTAILIITDNTNGSIVGLKKPFLFFKNFILIHLK